MQQVAAIRGEDVQLEVPCDRRNATAASLPMTCAATCVTASKHDGVHLGQHDRRAGCRQRDADLPRGQCAPAPIHRMSLAILMSARRETRKSPPKADECITHPARRSDPRLGERK